MKNIVENVPLWSVTIWDKNFNGVEKSWQEKTIKYKYLLSDELDRINIGGEVRLLYTGQDVGYTTEELAGEAICDGEIVSIPWGGTPSVKYYKGKFVTGDNRIATSSKPNELLNKFLFYYMKGHLREIASYYRGAGLKHPAMRDVLKMNISYPSVIDQEGIIKQFEAIENLIALRQKQLETMDSLIKARFVEMFGDPISNEKRWPTDPLTCACFKIYGGGTPSKSHPEYFEGSIPWVSPKDMKSDVIIDSIDHITEDAIENSTTNLVPEGSVLMVIRSGILKHDLPVAINAVPVTINQDMKAFVPGESITASFLRNYFKAIESDVLAGVRGVTADNIDFKAFQQREIIIPPILLQNEFEEFCKQVDKSKSVIQKSLDETQLLFDSLMQQYFG